MTEKLDVMIYHPDHGEIPLSKYVALLPPKGGKIDRETPWLLSLLAKVKKEKTVTRAQLKALSKEASKQVGVKRLMMSHMRLEQEEYLTYVREIPGYHAFYLLTPKSHQLLEKGTEPPVELPLADVVSSKPRGRPKKQPEPSPTPTDETNPNLI